MISALFNLFTSLVLFTILTLVFFVVLTFVGVVLAGAFGAPEPVVSIFVFVGAPALAYRFGFQ